MMNFNGLPIALDKTQIEVGCREQIIWNPEKHPMYLTVGGTGSGKSYFLSLLMGRISTGIPNSQLYLCDYKDIDFRRFAETPRRWSYENCTDGITAFYDSFNDSLNNKDSDEDTPEQSRKFLIFDEWAAYVVSRSDKKEQERVKSMLSTLLMMGRGVSTPHHVIIGLQRADAQLFPLGGRDQFGAILALGNLSREQKLMLFPDSREEMETVVNDRGQGFLSLDGEPLYRVQIPTITNHSKLDIAIRDGLTR